MPPPPTSPPAWTAPQPRTTNTPVPTARPGGTPRPATERASWRGQAPRVTAGVLGTCEPSAPGPRSGHGRAERDPANRRKLLLLSSGSDPCTQLPAGITPAQRPLIDPRGKGRLSGLQSESEAEVSTKPCGRFFYLHEMVFCLGTWPLSHTHFDLCSTFFPPLYWELKPGASYHETSWAFIFYSLVLRQGLTELAGWPELGSSSLRLCTAGPQARAPAPGSQHSRACSSGFLLHLWPWSCLGPGAAAQSHPSPGGSQRLLFLPAWPTCSACPPAQRGGRPWARTASTATVSHRWYRAVIPGHTAVWATHLNLKAQQEKRSLHAG